MSKGNKPNPKNRPPVLVTDIEEGGIIRPELEKVPWQFPLVDKTSFASMVAVGTLVTGTVKGNAVVISNGSNPLGFAPDNIAVDIIEYSSAGHTKFRGSIMLIKQNDFLPNEDDIWVALYPK